jgi:hypothetical protein
MLNNLREMSGGRLYALVPEGDNIPPCPEGYERLPGDAVVFGKIFLKCKARQETNREKECCGGKIKKTPATFCEDRDTFVSRQICLDCGGVTDREAKCQSA